jgi:hypothetical protein
MRSVPRPDASRRADGALPVAADRRPGRRLAATGLWLATIGGIAFGLQRLEDQVQQTAARQPWRMQWAKVPAELPDWILDEIAYERELYDLRPIFSRGLYDPQLCCELGTALGRSPWIARVERVCKRADGVVTVHASFRMYLTYVVRGGTGYLVDAEGVRLPRQEAEGALGQYGMILVEGVQAPVPAVGQPWAAPEVRAGLGLVAYLTKNAPRQLRAALRAVDVANYNNRLDRHSGWLRIRTHQPGTYILWGHPVGEEYDTESAPQRKLELLWSVYRDYGQIPPDWTDIDLRDPQQITYRLRR